MLRAGAAWAIRRSSSCEDLSYGRNRWLVNRVLNAASHSRITTTLTSTFLLQHNSHVNFATLLAVISQNRPYAHNEVFLLRVAITELPIDKISCGVEPECVRGISCYSASSERKLLLHKLMCIVMCCCRDSLI
jgi:hypothetical protein